MDSGRVPRGLDHHIYAPTSGPAEDEFPPFFKARRAPVKRGCCSKVFRRVAGDFPIRPLP